MTKEQAIAVVAIVRSGGIPQEFAPSTIDAWEDDLLPLPYDYCVRAARRWTLSVPVDEHGQPVPKFVSEPGSLLTGCGVPFGARQLVDRALRDGGEVYPSVRGLVSDGGWEYVAPGEPLPRGVGEWYVNAGLPLPPGRHLDPALDPALEPAPTRPALPPGEPITEEQRRANLARLGGLAKRLGASTAVGAGPSLAQRVGRVPRAPAPTVSPEVIEAELQAFETRYRRPDRGTS